MANRVRVSRIASKCKGLATAAAKINFFTLASSTNFAHPILTTEKIKQLTLLPEYDPIYEQSHGRGHKNNDPRKQELLHLAQVV